MKTAAFLLFGALAYSQTLVPVRSDIAPCYTLDYPGILEIGKTHIYLGCSDGSIVIYDLSLRYVQTVRFMRVANPITALALSSDPSEYFLFATTGNGEVAGNYVVHFDKRSPSMGGDLIAVKNEVQIASAADADLPGLKVLGLDLVVTGTRLNPEENRWCSVTANEAHVYATCGSDPLRVARGSAAFDVPSASEYRPGSTVVYSHAGARLTQLDNARLGCPAYAHADEKMLLRTCGSHKGAGLLVNSAANIDGPPIFFEKQWASVATSTSVEGSDYVALGTNSGEVLLLRPDLAAGTIREVSRANLPSVFKRTPIEQYRFTYDSAKLFTDFQVRAIASNGKHVVVLTRPRFHSQLGSQSVWSRQGEVPTAAIALFQIQ